MGNVNGREDGLGSPSGVDEEGGGGDGSARDSMGAADEALVGYPAPAELMGQSPPHSPRATQSPLMFTPQVSPLVFSFSPFSISGLI